MNSPYPEAHPPHPPHPTHPSGPARGPRAQLADASDQLPGVSETDRPDQPGGGGDRAFWVDPYRDGHPVDAERRDRGRVDIRPADELRCSLGRIIDLSTRGARITRRWAMTPGSGIFSFTLRSGRDELTLRGACVWSRKSGFMQHTAGIAFAGMTSEETQLLRAFIDRHAALPVVAA